MSSSPRAVVLLPTYNEIENLPRIVPAILDAAPVDLFIGGRNLTATKARLLLMASLMRFGSLPVAASPERPTNAELDAIREKLAAYQAVFDTH